MTTPVKSVVGVKFTEPLGLTTKVPSVTVTLDWVQAGGASEGPQSLTELVTSVLPVAGSSLASGCSVVVVFLGTTSASGVRSISCV